jgi:Sulfotransferase family
MASPLYVAVPAYYTCAGEGLAVETAPTGLRPRSPPSRTADRAGRVRSWPAFRDVNWCCKDARKGVERVDVTTDPARGAWPIVVGGCFRSGTSLLRRVLDAHSRIHCGPEVKFFRDFYGDYISDPLRHLRFFTSAHALVSESELLDVTGATFIALHERAALAAGKMRWADKNPENVLYLEQWQRLLGDAWLVVHMVRNPLDTLASMQEARFPLTLPPDIQGKVDV